MRISAPLHLRVFVVLIQGCWIFFPGSVLRLLCWACCRSDRLLFIVRLWWLAVVADANNKLRCCETQVADAIERDFNTRFSVRNFQDIHDFTHVLFLVEP